MEIGWRVLDAASRDGFAAPQMTFARGLVSIVPAVQFQPYYQHCSKVVVQPGNTGSQTLTGA